MFSENRSGRKINFWNWNR